MFPQRIEHVYIICTTTEHYPGVLYQVGEFLERPVEEGFPYACRLWTWRWCATTWKDPWTFCNYLKQRTRYADHYLADSEMTCLGYHMKRKLQPPEGEGARPVFRQEWLLPDFGQEIDADYLVAVGSLATGSDA